VGPASIPTAPSRSPKQAGRASPVAVLRSKPDALGQFEITFRIADGTPPRPITLHFTQAPDINLTDTFLVTSR
jgi:hypothetical protein